MTDDRDKRKRKTPPAGVAAQISSPVVEEDFEEKTPIGLAGAGESPVELRIRQARDTSVTTLKLVDGLRRETKQDIDKLHGKIDEHGKKLDGLTNTVGVLREGVGRGEGQNSIIIKMLEDQRAETQRIQHIKTTTRVAEVEVDKSRQLTELEIVKERELALIDTTKKDKDARREIIKSIVVKTIAAIGTVWAFISVTYLSKCGG